MADQLTIAFSLIYSKYIGRADNKANISQNAEVSNFCKKGHFWKRIGRGQKYEY